VQTCKVEIRTASECGVCGLHASNESPVAFVLIGGHEEQRVEECIDCWLSAEGVAYSPEAVEARTRESGARSQQED
jgi:hypothetical protein